MSTPLQRFPRGRFLDLPDLDSREPDESFLHLPFRDTVEGISSVLDRLASKAGQVFEALDAETGVRDLHNDFFRVVRAQRLSGRYSVAFTGTSRSDPTAATGLHVVSGSVEVVSTNCRAPYAKVHRRLGPGESCLLKDNESHAVTSHSGADVLQVVSPRWHRGRSLLLPAGADGLIVSERFHSPWRHRFRSALAARPTTRESRMGAFTSTVTRSLAPLRAMTGLSSVPSHRVMFVHAHPDDESSKGAATMAELVVQGHQVMVVTCTGGEQGSVLNPRAEYLCAEDISRVRSAEMARALKYLQVEHQWLGYADSGMPADGVAPPGTFAARTDEATADLVGVIRRFRPDVLVTYNETGGYPHPDHVAAHQVSLAAVAAAQQPSHPEFGEPWTVAKVYYHVPLDAEVASAAHRALLGEGRESPFGRLLEHWKKHPQQDPASRITTRVRARRRSVVIAERALSSHRSQVHDQSPARLLPGRQRRVEKFQRVTPPPDPGERENSLLAGLAGSGRRGRPRSARRVASSEVSR